MRASRVAGALLVAAVVAEMVRLRWHYATGRRLAERAERFDRRAGQGRRRVLVIGDSSAVGTGADAPEDSVAGRLAAAYPRVDIWNLAENGLRADGLATRLAALRGSRFDLVLIHVGVNDIVRFTALPRLREQVTRALRAARALSQRVVVMTGGDIGLAPGLTPGLRWIVSRRSRAVRLLFLEVSAATDAVYVDMCDGVSDRPFVENPRRFFARDGFHPNSEGYGLWYEAVTAALDRMNVHLE